MRDLLEHRLITQHASGAVTNQRPDLGEISAEQALTLMNETIIDKGVIITAWTMKTDLPAFEPKDGRANFSSTGLGEKYEIFQMLEGRRIIENVERIAEFRSARPVSFISHLALTKLGYVIVEKLYPRRNNENK